MKKTAIRVTALCLSLLLSGLFFPVSAHLEAETQRRAIIAKWQEEKAPFTLRKSLTEQKEKRANGTLSREEEIRFPQGEILVCIQKGYTITKGTFTKADFPEIEIESMRDLSAEANRARSERGVKTPFCQILHITLKDKSEEALLSACETLLLRDEVLSAEPNYIFTAEEAYTVSDPLYDSVYTDGGGNNFFNRISYEKIFASEAWDFLPGDSSVTVAVIDTGVKEHEDLQGALVEGRDTFNENTITSDAYDDHGTHVAGIIAARANGKGVIGIAPNVKIMPMQFIFVNEESQLSYKAEDLIQVFEHLEEQNVPIANMSLSLGISTVESTPCIAKVIKDYCDGCDGCDCCDGYDGDRLFVCAAGNDGMDVDLNKQYPSWFEADNMICVANMNAFSQEVSLASSSNFGKENVDIAAPGVLINSTIGTAGYGFMSGTSMASPMVAGAAALIKSVCPDYGMGQIKELLLNTATKDEALEGAVGCGGYLNIGRALNLLTPAYRTTFHLGRLDSFGQMSLWQHSSSLTSSSSSATVSIDDNQDAYFETRSRFDTEDAVPGYSYNRLSSNWRGANEMGLNPNMGVTIDLSLRLNMSPLKSTVTRTTPKFGQTGFVIDVHMDATDEEFYLCIAQKEESNTVVVSSFGGNRESLNSAIPSVVEFSLPSLETAFQRFTFSYCPQKGQIDLYVNGARKGSLGAPTKRSAPALDADFVCFSLVNRENVNCYEVVGETPVSGTSRAWLSRLFVYNTDLTEDTAALLFRND